MSSLHSNRSPARPAYISRENFNFTHCFQPNPTATPFRTLQAKPDPDIYARVDRAKTRLAVLKEVAEERYFETESLTATRIKKLMREHHPLGLNHVLAALQFLEEHDLVEVVDRTAK